MAQEFFCGPARMTAAQDVTMGSDQPIELDRDRFFVQLANALTVLDGWVYLAQMSTGRTRQEQCLGAIKQTVQQLTQYMQDYWQKP